MVTWLSRLFGRTGKPDRGVSDVTALMREIPRAKAAGPETARDLGGTLAAVGLENLAAGRPARAAQALAAADTLGHAAPYFLYNLALAYSRSGQAALAAETFRRAQAGGPRDANGDGFALRNLNTQDGLGLAELRAAAEDWAAHHVPAAPGPADGAPDPSVGSPLRVGLLSGRFHRHAVGFLTLSALEALDRDRFELVMFDNSTYADDYTDRFKAIAAGWRDIRALSDDDAAALIRGERTDVLLDLGGHSAGGRIGIFARRSAPVQAKWVGGQHGTTGVPAMDYFISDAVETPPDHDPHFVENVIRLPASYACYTPPADAPEVSELPARSRGTVTFGCFNNLAKVGPRTIEVWSRLLSAVSDSRLVLKHSALAEVDTQDRIKADFAAFGIDPARLDLRVPTGHVEHLGAYRDIDIALDPFPWSGCVTTCESLWMGVPVLTLPGVAFCHRHSASFLASVGLTEWIADSEDAYVAKAVAAASDLTGLEHLRDTLRNRVAQSPLCDGASFAQSFGRALFEMAKTGPR